MVSVERGCHWHEGKSCAPAPRNKPIAIYGFKSVLVEITLDVIYIVGFLVHSLVSGYCSKVWPKAAFFTGHLRHRPLIKPVAYWHYPSIRIRGDTWNDWYYSETRLTQPRITRKLAYLKPSFMVLAWVIIICWAYLELLVITRTDKLRLVPSNCLFCGWMCSHSCVTSLFHWFLFTWEENLTNFRK